MSDLITLLQNKPKKTRKRIAIGMSSLITFFIFLFWVVSFSTNIPGKEYADVSPFKNLNENVAGVASVFKESFVSLSENFKSSIKISE